MGPKRTCSELKFLDIREFCWFGEGCAGYVVQKVWKLELCVEGWGPGLCEGSHGGRGLYRCEDVCEPNMQSDPFHPLNERTVNDNPPLPKSTLPHKPASEIQPHMEGLANMRQQLLHAS